MGRNLERGGLLKKTVGIVFFLDECVDLWAEGCVQCGDVNFNLVFFFSSSMVVFFLLLFFSFSKKKLKRKKMEHYELWQLKQKTNIINQKVFVGKQIISICSIIKNAEITILIFLFFLVYNKIWGRNYFEFQQNETNYHLHIIQSYSVQLPKQLPSFQEIYLLQIQR